MEFSCFILMYWPSTNQQQLRPNHSNFPMDLQPTGVQNETVRSSLMGVFYNGNTQNTGQDCTVPLSENKVLSKDSFMKIIDL